MVIKLKKTPISKLKKKLMELVKAQVRLRDQNICQHCKKTVFGSNCHVSHVIPVSAGNILAFDPLNMKILCYHCHLNWWHKNPTEAGDWFKEAFPDRWAYLKSKKNQTVHWKEADYLQMVADLTSN